MKTNLSLVLVAALALAGCAGSTQSADVSASVRRSLDDAGLKDVSVNQDRAKGIVTLGGHVSNEQDKARAESLARPLAAGQVVAMEVAVIPVGDESRAKAVNSDLDKGIEHNVVRTAIPGFLGPRIVEDGGNQAGLVAPPMRWENLPLGSIQQMRPALPGVAIGLQQLFQGVLHGALFGSRPMNLHLHRLKDHRDPCHWASS